MKTLRALIVDDEPLARDGLRDLLRSASDIDIAGECSNGVDAIEAILRLKPDMVFLDIQMPEVNGFEVVEQVKDEWRPAVVFVTAYDAFAVKAFDVHAIDYLLKPVDPERFTRALERVRARLRQAAGSELPENLRELLRDVRRTLPSRDRIPVRTGSGFLLLKAAEIDWVEAEREYVVLHTREKDHIVRSKISEFEERLPGDQFARIHRSIIVNLDRVREIVPLFSGEYSLTLVNGAKLRSGRTYADTVKSLLSRFG